MNKIRATIIGVLLMLLLLLSTVLLINSGALSGLGLGQEPVDDYIMINYDDSRVTTLEPVVIEDRLISKHMMKFFNFITHKKGVIEITALDKQKGFSLPNRVYKIEKVIDGEIVDEVLTDDEGYGQSIELDFHVAYRISSLDDNSQYMPYGQGIIIELNTERLAVSFEYEMYNDVLDYEQNEAGDILINSVSIPVPQIYQLPELPNGCEITSLASVLQSYGIEANHLMLADRYLVMSGFYTSGGKYYGANPEYVYPGNPRTYDGWYIFPPGLIASITEYFKDQNLAYEAIDVSGSTLEQIKAYLSKGIPVVTWVTLDLSDAKRDYAWYLDDGSETYYRPFINLHCVVTYGYENGNILFMDPIKGLQIRDEATFFKAYESIGSRGVVIHKTKSD